MVCRGGGRGAGTRQCLRFPWTPRSSDGHPYSDKLTQKNTERPQTEWESSQFSPAGQGCVDSRSAASGGPAVLSSRSCRWPVLMLGRGGAEAAPGAAALRGWGCWGRGAEQEKSKEIWNFTLAPASNTAKLLVECSGSVFKHRVCQLREKTFRGFIKCFILC